MALQIRNMTTQEVDVFLRMPYIVVLGTTDKAGRARLAPT